MQKKKSAVKKYIHKKWIGKDKYFLVGNCRLQCLHTFLTGSQDGGIFAMRLLSGWPVKKSMKTMSIKITYQKRFGYGCLRNFLPGLSRYISDFRQGAQHVAA